VYADWLSEQDHRKERARAAFLRAQAEGRPPTGSKRTLGADWLARVDRTGIDRCDAELSFSFECPKRWEALVPTERPKVRSCAACQEEVYWCATVEEARGYAMRGRCVAVCSLEPRQPGDLRVVRMGRMMVRR
jgi:hypothetical protein